MAKVTRLFSAPSHTNNGNLISTPRRRLQFGPKVNTKQGTVSTNFIEPPLPDDDDFDGDHVCEVRSMHTDINHLPDLKLHPTPKAVHMELTDSGVCGDAARLAQSCASSPDLGQGLKCAIAVGQLLAVRESKAAAIPLLNAQVALVDLPDPTRLLIAVVPATKPIVEEEEEEENPAIKSCDSPAGWILTCPVAARQDVMMALSACGCIRYDVSSEYSPLEVDGEVGKGGFGHVSLAVGRFSSSSAKSRVVAVKTYKAKVKDDEVLMEVSLLVAAQGHPNILGFRGIFVTEEHGTKTWSLVTDYCKGGDLFSQVVKKGTLSELEARPLMNDLMSALAHTHERHIIHRDIKPENLLLAHDGSLVLADFGISAFITDTKRLSKRCGSVGYAAPEQYKAKTIGIEVDMFASGVVLYFLLARTPPFLASTPALSSRKTCECRPDYSKTCFKKVSTECIDFLGCLIRKNPKERLTARESMEHEWFQLAVGRLCFNPAKVEWQSKENDMHAPLMQRLPSALHNSTSSLSVGSVSGSQREDESFLPGQVHMRSDPPRRTTAIVPMKPVMAPPLPPRASLYRRVCRGLRHAREKLRGSQSSEVSAL